MDYLHKYLLPDCANLQKIFLNFAIRNKNFLSPNYNVRYKYVRKIKNIPYDQ